ncbi:hypothetical protein N9A07_01330 [Candidatus Pelagibacter ubique]|nr:hypothetical protein [Candidatus Pelagibacter ubique]
MSSIVKVDTIQENTSANGITVDGLNIKDSKLVTANSVVTANITDANITAAKLASGVLPTNTPYFRVFASSNQSMSNATETKVTFGGENFDTNNDFASSRFTPTVAGKYFIASQVNTTYSGNAPVNEYLYLKKNGTLIMSGQIRGAGHGYGFNYLADIVSFNGSSDYVEIFAYGDNTSSYIIEGNSNGTASIFYGYKIIE